MNQHVLSLNTIKTERLRTLARYLQKMVPDAHFDMNLWRPDMDATATWDQLFFQHDCGAPACIAGHTLNLFRSEARKFDFTINTAVAAQEILGLTYEDAAELFVPDNLDHYRATPRMAAKVIEHFIETGKVEWSIIDADLEN